MKKGIRIFGFSMFFATVASLFSCSTLHVHDQSSPYGHNETEHWQVCTECGKKFNNEAHTFDYSDNTCHICNYHDPVFKVDGFGVMSGLTEYGKTKEVLGHTGVLHDDPEFRNVLVIDDHAFKGSKASRVVIPSETIACSETAFVDTPIEPEDEKPGQTKWNKIEGIEGYYIKEDIYKTNDVMVNGVPYETLQKAIDDQKVEAGATITLLKDKDYGTTSINVSKSITISTLSLLTSATLKCNFTINANATLRILDTVKYTGEAHLKTSKTPEVHGKETHESLTSGSLVFNNTTTEPQNVFVYYDIDNKGTHRALGAPQITPKMLIFESDNYAYGTFNFSEDFKQITGLTDFGQSVTTLTIHSVASSVKNVAIVNSCFIRYGEEVIKIRIIFTEREIKVSGNFQKGRFKYVTIGDGITSIGADAFSTGFEAGHMDQALREAVSLIMCPLVEIDLGNSIENIYDRAFRFCGSLAKVTGGTGLKNIFNGAFGDCYQLTTLDLSKSVNLEFISKDVFGACNKLVYANMPKENWRIGKNGECYPEFECTPENMAFWLRTRHLHDDWKRNPSDIGCYIYYDRDKDTDGHHNKANYVNNLQYALDIAKDDSIIHITKSYKNPNELSNLVVKSRVRIIFDNDVENAQINGLTINTGCYAIIEGKVNITGNINIKKENNNRGTGGLAIGKDATITGTPKFNEGDSALGVNCSIADSLNASTTKPFTGYGLCDFERTVKDNAITENLISLSNLGTKCFDIELKEQTVEAPNSTKVLINSSFIFGNNNGNVIRNIKFGRYIEKIGQDAFEHMNHLETIEFELGSILTELDRGVFYQDRTLTTAKLDHCSKLKSIGKYCFQECNISTIDCSATEDLEYIGTDAFLKNPLQEFYLKEDVQFCEDWKFYPTKGNKVDLPWKDLYDANTCAKLLTTTYCDGEWKHEPHKL